MLPRFIPTLVAIVLVAPAEAGSPSQLEFNRSMRFVEGADYEVATVQRPDDTPVFIWWYRDQRMTEAACNRVRLADWGGVTQAPRLPDWSGVLACASRGSIIAIIATVGASESTIDHEWCHVYGWRHPDKKPAVCETKPWRSFPGAMNAPDHVRARWGTTR